MTHVRKFPVSGPSIDWGSWTEAWFQSEDARDRFVCAVAEPENDGWGAEANPKDGLGARVRWRPGKFLRLNDVAYAHGGRIVVVIEPHWA